MILTLFSIFGINFDIGYLMVFLTGAMFGFLLLLLVYLYSVLATLNSKRKIKDATEPDIDEEEIKLLIKDAQNQYKDKKRREEVGFATYVKQLALDLSKDIASKFYPNSKHPHLELTLDETLLLGHYITDRIDKIFDARLLKIFRKTTLAKIMSLYEMKQNIDESAVMKAEKKLKVRKTANVVFSAINILNPAYWIKKVTVDKLTQMVINKIALSVIGIVGEETYKIYSKNVFKVEKTIDTGVDDLYEEIKGDVKKYVEEADLDDTV